MCSSTEGFGPDLAYLIQTQQIHQDVQGKSYTLLLCWKFA